MSDKACPNCQSVFSQYWLGRTRFTCRSWIDSAGVLYTTELCDSRKQLAEANEYARKLNIKIADLCAERDAVKSKLQTRIDVGDLLYEELDDKTPEEPNCQCVGALGPCTDCERHTRSRVALNNWREIK